MLLLYFLSCGRYSQFMPNPSPDEFNRLVTETFGTIGHNPAVYIHNFNQPQQGHFGPNNNNNNNNRQNPTPTPPQQLQNQAQPQTQPPNQPLSNNANDSSPQNAFFSSPSLAGVSPSAFATSFSNPNYPPSASSQNNSWANNNNSNNTNAFAFEELRNK